MKRIARIFLATALFAALCQAAEAACSGPGILRLSDETLPMASDPDRLLKGFPRGGDGMQVVIVAVVTGDRMGLRTVTRSITNANFRQKQAIAGGMAQVVATCSSKDPALVKSVLQSVQRFTDPDMKLTFNRLMYPDEAPLAERKAVAGRSSAIDNSTLPLSGPIVEDAPVTDFPDPSAPVK